MAICPKRLKPRHIAVQGLRILLLHVVDELCWSLPDAPGTGKPGVTQGDMRSSPAQPVLIKVTAVGESFSLLGLCVTSVALQPWGAIREHGHGRSPDMSIFLVFFDMFLRRVEPIDRSSRYPPIAIPSQMRNGRSMFAKSLIVMGFLISLQTRTGAGASTRDFTC